MEAGLPVHGDRLDCFEVQQAIGVGGMGAVFRALDVRLDRFVALKVLPPGQTHEAENVRRFYQEGRAAARLDHENIARVFTIGQDKGLHYIAFEYIEGTTIRQRVEQHGILPVAEAINFTLQIAGALVHASERGVIHRDIKPSNIIVTPHGRAKLVDMGLARRFEREGADDGLTQSNMTLGTFDYISPEQARDPRSVDVRSDLYSLGCTIYHMLTGQPPFPGGTVLQKLLSHREEPAPDVRVLNPSVPADLAAIVLKLMAKDPDRRYQTPEQLVRDLLTLAGALGLRSISPEGLVWMNAAPRSAGWERHLFWGLPAAALAVVVAGLVWMGRTPADEPDLGLLSESMIGPVDPGPSAPPPPPGPSTPAPGTNVPLPSAANAPAAADVSSTAARQDGGAADSPLLSPRERRVRSDEDLRAVLRSEPPGSTVLLDDGPYRLAPADEGEPPLRVDLTIRADVGTRPVIEAAPGNGPGTPGGPLLHFAGGRVTLEGLAFQLGPGGPASGPAIRAEGTALRLNRCLVQGAGRPAALELIAPASTPHPSSAVATPGDGQGTMSVVLETCSLGGAGVGALARGPVTLGLRDCTVAARGPAIWFNNAPIPSAADAFGFGPDPEPESPGPGPVAAWLWLDHVSLVADIEPVLRSDGTSLRADVRGSLVAPPRDLVFGLPTLMAIDDPDRLNWMGFGNLYARLGAFLVPTADPKDRPRVFEFDAWAGGTSTSETGSRATTEHVWVEPDPGAALARGLPASESFRPTVSGVLPADRSGSGPSPATIGSRRGPSGPIAPVAPAIADATATLSDAEAARLTGFDPNPMTPGPMTLSPGDAATSRPRPSEPVEGEMPPPLAMTRVAPQPEPPGTGVAAPGMSQAEAIAAPVPDPVDPADPADTASPPSAAPAEGPIRTPDQFLDRIARLGPRGGVLTLAADARLDLPPRVVGGSGSVEIVAEPGPTRPLLRLRDESPAPSPTDDWSYLLRIDREGELYLRGIDIVLDGDSGPLDSPLAAFGLGPDATLDLTDCTITIDGPAPSAAIRLIAPAPAAASPEGSGRFPASNSTEGTPPAISSIRGAAQIRIVDSLLRCAGDAVNVAPGARLDDLKITNGIVACAGSLLHGHGHSPVEGAGAAIGEGVEISLVLSLRRVTVVAHDGIVRLDSTADRPTLPVAEVSARESILATGPGGDALFRVEGQGELYSLSDRIRVVESREVAYHQIGEYRRVETSQPGTLPVVLDRDDWSLALGRNEVDALHDNVGFLADPGPDRDPWALHPDDVRLDPEGLAADLGPDLSRIPRPPDANPPGEALPNRPAVEVIDRIRRLLPPTIP